MKTSNKLLLAAALIMVGYCVVSAFALKKELLKGDYKSRFYHMKRVDIKDFDAIEADLSHSNINIEYGNEFAIWIQKDADNLNISKINKTLKISYKKNDDPNTQYWGTTLIIICPKLLTLKLGKTLTFDERTAIKLDPNKINVDGAINTLKGFKQDTLAVEINNATSVQLQQTNIGKLNAVANWGKLFVTGPNNIDTANFDIRTHSRLDIDYAEIKHPTYKLDGVSKITVSGESFGLLSKK